MRGSGLGGSIAGAGPIAAGDSLAGAGTAASGFAGTGSAGTLRANVAGGVGRMNSHQYIAANATAIATNASTPAFTYGFESRSPMGSKRMFCVGTTMPGRLPPGMLSESSGSTDSAGMPRSFA